MSNWKITMFNKQIHLHSWWIFHCHVSFRGGGSIPTFDPFDTLWIGFSSASTNSAVQKVLEPLPGPTRAPARRTWKIIPVTRWLVTPICKPFRPFGRSITLPRGLTITMVLNYLHPLGWSFKCPPGNEKTYPTKREKENHRLKSAYTKVRIAAWRNPILYTFGTVGSMKPSHLEKTKVSWFMPFLHYTYIYIYVRYRVPKKKKKLSRVATFLGSTLTTNRSSQVVCVVCFAVFSCYVVLKQLEPSPKVFANNRHTRIMILPTHTTALLSPQSLT